MADKKAPVPVLYKPFGSPGSANANKATISSAKDAKEVDIVDPNGNVIIKGQKDTVPHTPEPGAIPGPYNQNWWVGPASGIPPGSSIRITNADGSQSYAAVKDPYQGTKGFVNDGEGDSPSDAAVIPANGHPEAQQSGIPGQFSPGQVGNFGATPAYIGGLFPAAAQATFNPITAAPYNFTDPMKYAEQFGAFNRGEIQKNFDQSKDLALNELDTELSSLKNFVPAAAALKQQQTSLDNVFNQAQRTQQVNTALPGVNDQLNAQASRATSYANGAIPDAVQNQAFELGVRSAAADSAAAGGFGASSSVARKASDLLSATQRIGLSKYGDSLLSSNITQKAALNLAPTEYSNAGSQVNVNPSLSATQLISSNLNAINGLTTISPTTGLQSTTQQNQFTTGLQQQTEQFNSGNELQASEFNTQATNQFALDKFGYQAQYANSVAGSAQNNINTNFQLQQQQQFADTLNQLMQSSQLTGLLSALSGLGAGLIPSATKLFSGCGSNPFSGSQAGTSPGASNPNITGSQGGDTGSTGSSSYTGSNTYGSGGSDY